MTANEKTKLMIDIGTKLRAARREAGLTQADLAGREFSKSYISQVEQGQTIPSITSLVQLSRVLHRPVTYFFEEPPYEPPLTQTFATCPSCGERLHVTIRSMDGKA